jgi:hypothetical protein
MSDEKDLIMQEMEHNLEKLNTKKARTKKVEAVEVEIEPIPQPEVVAPPKRKSTKTTIDRGLESNIRMLIVTSFTFASTKIHPVWSISDEEAKSLSEPITRIMQRMGVAETASANADYIALAIAVSIVIIPRVMMTPKKQKIKPTPPTPPTTQPTPPIQLPQQNEVKKDVAKHLSRLL